jgi:plastocyanin
VELGPRIPRGALRSLGSALLVATVALLGAGCGRGATPVAGGSAPTPPATSQPLPVAGSPAPYTPATCEASGAKLMIVAKADEFSLNCMAVAAGAPTTITLVNKDSSSHNLAIYEDPEVGVLMPAGDAYTALFRGGLVANRAVYEIPQLTSGTYYFRCDIHPLMNGTFLVP